MTTNKENAPGEVTQLVERYLEIESRGEQADLKLLCLDAPHLAEPAAQEIAAIKKMNHFLDTENDESDQAQGEPPSIGKRSGHARANSQYLIQRFLAHGGCSEVYIAEDTNLGRTVAIKFLRPDVQNLESFQLRLKREAKITSCLDHPGIVSIHASGIDEHGMPFYSMRFVEGSSFGTKIKQFHAKGSSITSPEFRKLVNHLVDVCQTMAYAHSRGVIHRDLKPENVVTGSFGETYVVDWGLAKKSGIDEELPISDSNATDLTASDTNAEFVTQQGNSIGTPAFMSPEQASGQPIGSPSDLFNLGATLYMMLTGSPPYQGSSLAQVLSDARAARFQTLNERGIPKPLVAICKKAMACDPRQRYESARVMANDLECYLADEPVSVYRDGLAENARRWIKKNRVFVSTTAIAGLAILLILVASTKLLYDANVDLVKRESEANFHKGEAKSALLVATENLYVQRIALAESELNKNNVVRARELLDECPLEYRSWEWYLLMSRVQKHVPFHTVSTDGRVAKGLAYSHDGESFAVGHSGGTILLFDMSRRDSNAFLTPIDQLDDGMNIECLEFSPDGKRLLVAGSEKRKGRIRGALHLWDLTNKTILKKRWGHGRTVNCISWSSDGTRLATGGEGGGIRIRNADTLEPELRIDHAHQGSVRAIKFDGPSNEHVVSAGNDGLIQWWKSDGTKSKTKQGHAQSANCLQLKGGHIYTGGNDKLLRRWGTTSDSQNTNDVYYVGNNDHVETMDVSHDGRFVVSGGLDRNVRIWNAESGEIQTTIRHHTSHVRRVLFGPNGQFLITSGDDCDVKIWKISELIEQTPEGQTVAFSKVSPLLVAVNSRNLSLWDAATHSPVVRKIAGSPAVIRVAFCNQSDSFASMCTDGSVVFRDAQDAMRPRTLNGSQSACFCGVFSADDSLLFVGHGDGTIHCWDLATNKIIHTAKWEHHVTGIQLSPDTTTLVTSSWRNGSLGFWDTNSLSPQFEVSAHPNQTLGMAMHPTKNKLATTGNDGSVKVWNTDNGDLVQSIRFGASWLNTVSYTPDGARLVMGSEHTVLFWNCKTNQEVLSMSVDRCVHSISFSHDSRFMAVAGESPQVRIWSVGPDDSTKSIQDR